MENKCPQCGTELPATGLGGLCPACLMKAGAAESATQRGRTLFEPPTVAALAGLFPQLEVLELIGRGGMGAVYKARQPLLDRIVALKILPAQVTLGTDFADRFTREARALARLNHANIVMVYDFGQANGQPYFIMEYVDGMNLRQLQNAGNLTPAQALQIVPQICEALQFAHDAGIVHRDIKPDNILVDKKGRVKIADFGIAKIIGTAADPAIPVTQGAIGTPHYMAPEQVDRPQTVDHRADIFSLGVVFYEMLTGELPLGKFAPPSSSTRGLQVDVRLDEVVFRALEREPNRRYQHASQVKQAVETIAGTAAPAGFGTSHPGLMPEAVLARDYQLGIASCVSRGWALVKSDFWPLVGVTALILALMGIASSTMSRFGTAGNSTAGFSALALLLNGPLGGGLYLYYLKRVRHERATVETAFSGFGKRFLHLFLANFVVAAFVTLGFLCFVLPGIFLAVSWVFTLLLVIDREMDFWPAMELSRKAVYKHWWKVLLLLLACGGLLLAGLLACGIGLLVAVPVAIAAGAYAYEDIFGAATPPRAAGGPASPPLPAGPAAFGPGGTMVMPGAAGGSPPVSPGTPPASAKPPPLGAVPPGLVPPLPATTPAGSGGSGKHWLIMGLIGLGGLLLLLIVLLALLPGFDFNLGNERVSHRFGIPSIRATSVSAVARPPRPPEPPHNPAFQALADRVRQELAQQAAVHFDDLSAASTASNNLTLSFTGLRKQLAAETTVTPSGILVTDEDSTVSISASNGIEITDKDSNDTTSISFPGLHINVNNVKGSSPHPENDLNGTLIGTKMADGAWKFTGAGELAPVAFTVAQLDLADILADRSPAAPFGTGPNSDESLKERLEAAEVISDESTKSDAMEALAKDAAAAGNMAVVRSALSGVSDADAWDATARACALSLMSAGRRPEAVEIAKGIHDPDVRDKVLAELAQ